MGQTGFGPEIGFNAGVGFTTILIVADGVQKFAGTCGVAVIE